MKKLLCLLLPTLLLAACASLPPQQDCVSIGPRGAVCPLPPAALPEFAARHLVTVTRPGHSDSFLGRLQIDDQALRLAGASLFGTHLFTVTLDADGIHSQPADAELHGDMIVAMLEVALASPAALRPALHGLQLQVQRSADGEVRELHGHGHLVARIERRGSPLAAAHIDIHVPPAKLTLHLQPLTERPDGLPASE